MSNTPKQTTVDARFINPFIESTTYVLKTMCQIEAKRTQILLKGEIRSFGDASAVIGLMGDGLEGSVAITLGQQLMSEIVAKMVGADASDLGLDEVYDGLGEMVNMIAGNAKSQIASMEGMQLSLALPTIVTGSGHEIAHRSDTPCIVIIFQIDGQTLALQIAIKINMP